MKNLITILSLSLFMLGGAIAAPAQSNNFKAQGFYYKAKELKEAGSYRSAISYCKKAEEALEGSNLELQYLYILCYYYDGDYVNAQKEMARFFDFKGDKNNQIKRFDKSVERITDDETKAITKLMVDIDEKADYENTHVTCGHCKGSGKESYHKSCSYCDGEGTTKYYSTCSHCNGKGGEYFNQGTAVGTHWFECVFCGGEGKSGPKYRNCSHCSGKGYTIDTRTCSVCYGSGKVAKE